MKALSLFNFSCRVFLFGWLLVCRCSGASSERRRVWVRYAPGRHDAILGSIQQQQQQPAASQGAGGAASGTPQHALPEVLYDFSAVNSVVVSATEDEIAELQKDPNVVKIEDDPKRYAVKPLTTAVEDDEDPPPLLEWTGQAIGYGVKTIQAIQMHQELNLTGRGVKVCVIDSGFDPTHPDLLLANSTGTSLVSSPDGTVFDWDDDYEGHGTHVGGIIAMADNEEGLLGVAPDVTLHHVRVFDAEIVGDFVYASALVDAAYACRDAGANIINMSLGGPDSSQAEEEAFRDLYLNHNVLSISSSGNDGSPSGLLESVVLVWYLNARKSYPSAYPTVMSVAAVDWRKEIAAFSSYQHTVDIAAPGVAVWSAIPTNDECDLCQIFPSSEYRSLSGTSMAAPHVAGAAALLWSNDLTVGADVIRDALLASAQDLGDTGRDDYYGYGLVQTRAAFDILSATLNGDREVQEWPDGPSDFYYDFIHPIFRVMFYPIEWIVRFLLF